MIVLSFPIFSFPPLRCHNIAHPSTLVLTIFFEKCQGNSKCVALPPSYVLAALRPLDGAETCVWLGRMFAVTRAQLEE